MNKPLRNSLAIMQQQWVEQIVELESRLEVAEADNDARAQAMRDTCFQHGDLVDYCVHCGIESGHEIGCIVEADHPGSQILERLEAAEKALNRIKESKKTDMYTARGMITDALAAYDKAKEPKP